MKTRIISVITVILTVTALAVLLGAFSARAAGVIEIGSTDELLDYMSRTGDYSLRIAKNISGSLSYSSGSDTHPVWCTVGKGSKILDLNGKEVRISYDNWKDRTSSLFLIPSGASVTVKDATDTGSLFYDGYIKGYKAYAENNAKDAALQSRSIFLVEGGNLTVNGGVIEAGRSKNEWCNRVARFDTTGETDEGVLVPMDVTKYVNGSAVILRSGEVTVNDGVFYGRGLSNIKGAGDTIDSYRTSCYGFSRRAVVEATGGSLNINGGYFKAKGNADVFRIGNSVQFNITAARLQLHHNDYFMEIAGVETITRAIKGSYGSVGLPESVWNDAGLEITSSHGIDGKTVKEFEEYLLLKNDDYGEPYFTVAPKSKSTSVHSDFLPDRNIPTLNPAITGQMKFYTDYTPVYSYHPLAGNGRDHKANFTYTVFDMTGKPLSYGEDAKSVMTTDDSGFKGEIDLANSSYLTSQLESGKMYIVCSSVTEMLDGAYPMINEASSVMTIKITDSQKPVLVEVPDTIIAVANKGDTVTLTARATNATSAEWYNYPEGGTLDNATMYNRRDRKNTNENGVFTSTLTINEVKGRFTVYCKFSNAAGDTYTYEIAVDIKALPTFSYGETLVNSTVNSANVTLSNRINGAEPENVTWYKDGRQIATWDTSANKIFASDTRLQMSTPGESLTQKLVITPPVVTDSGEYYYVVTTTSGNFTSPIITLTVTDPSLSIDEHTEHTFGKATDKGDGTHVRYCTECGFGAKEIHNWGAPSDPYTDNGVRYVKLVCTECGATRQSKVYEIYGDANDDGEVSALDIVRLKAYIAAGKSSSVIVGPGADANGDSAVDSLDVVRLKRYFAEYDHLTDKSSVKLGK